jgi:hypothetical protein
VTTTGKKIQFHENWGQRPVKSPGKRKQRVKAQKKRLLEAGMDKAKVSKLGVKETREALKTIRK